MIIRNVFAGERAEEQAHDGNGLVEVYRAMTSSDFVCPWNFVAYAVLPPSATIGLHRHEDEEELFFVLEGEGLVTIDEEQQRVVKGDLILTPLGGTHGMINNSSQNMALLVIEVRRAK